MTPATFYIGKHDCGVCVEAGEGIVRHLAGAYEVETVDLTANPGRVGDAERAGVRTLPALVAAGRVFHINHGIDLAALK